MSLHSCSNKFWMEQGLASRKVNLEESPSCGKGLRITNTMITITLALMASTQSSSNLSSTSCSTGSVFSPTTIKETASTPSVGQLTVTNQKNSKLNAKMPKKTPSLSGIPSILRKHLVLSPSKFQKVNKLIS